MYIHIPFCKKRCLYCDFFSTTLLERRDEYLVSLLREIEARKQEAEEPIRTIYFGGGTPSTLAANDIVYLLRAIGTADAEEITVEINPGDATEAYFRTLREGGVNRLSIGIQSFKDHVLQQIGRRHTAVQAIDAVRMAQHAGFDNLSIDLMYALPGLTMSQWMADISLALRLGVQHISTYGLMYEEGTALTRMRDKGEIQAVDEDTENEMYDYICQRLQQEGYVHYEVSNFALPGFEAKHNSSYWDGTPYIGIGAGAHSYTGGVRSANPDNLDAYIRGMSTGTLQRTTETLTDKDLYNERIMLGLRTNKGVAGAEIQADITPFLTDGMLRQTEDGRVIATQKGLHVLNRIIEELMIE